jgi:transposase
VLDAHEAFILGALQDKPDTTLEEMVERLAAERGVRVVTTAVWKFLDRRDQTHKKRPLTPASKSVPT